MKQPLHIQKQWQHAPEKGHPRKFNTLFSSFFLLPHRCFKKSQTSYQNNLTNIHLLQLKLAMGRRLAQWVEQASHMQRLKLLDAAVPVLSPG